MKHPKNFVIQRYLQANGSEKDLPGAFFHHERLSGSLALYLEKTILEKTKKRNEKFKNIPPSFFVLESLDEKGRTD